MVSSSSIHFIINHFSFQTKIIIILAWSRHFKPTRLSTANLRCFCSHMLWQFIITNINYIFCIQVLFAFDCDPRTDKFFSDVFLLSRITLVTHEIILKYLRFGYLVFVSLLVSCRIHTNENRIVRGNTWLKSRLSFSNWDCFCLYHSCSVLSRYFSANLKRNWHEFKSYCL